MAIDNNNPKKSTKQRTILRKAQKPQKLTPDDFPIEIIYEPNGKKYRLDRTPNGLQLT